MTEYADIAAVEAAVGKDEFVSDWFEITQERVNTFADATEDHQWIHVDPERAKAGPFGAPIAHGFLTLSLLPYLADGAVSIKNTLMGVNYGMNKVRFINPVAVGSRIRTRSVIAGVERVPQGARITSSVTVEIEGVEKPAAIAETIALHVLAQPA
ncbi:MaoC family dehydratase [Salinibacterium sp. dk2585]|uniref:MaoC family dehydratase n=1 Tax=unclassified Salinibacterium TaxID=2632331 RepID=UPI0011C24B74|nr:MULTISPECIES: MaoC family dehydratase [unclassified Salinibacterium]QEE62262.1 MaoC family dehydratase [Salinibacterium sp. dk2585]TXK53614.1 MaoC family dehydratase [Salinibacterium sp. dk5596]